MTRKIEIGACSSCMDTRGLAGDDLIIGMRRSSMAELAEWSVWAHKILIW